MSGEARIVNSGGFYLQRSVYGSSKKKKVQKQDQDAQALSQGFHPGRQAVSQLRREAPSPPGLSRVRILPRAPGGFGYRERVKAVLICR